MRSAEGEVDGSDAPGGDTGAGAAAVGEYTGLAKLNALFSVSAVMTSQVFIFTEVVRRSSHSMIRL